ncbi:MAG: glutathione S-transferase C-terminal domain-containing protein [Deltaproteobacteria bacterium]
MNPRRVLWGSVLSPFALKIRAMFEHARLPLRSLPAEGGRVENLRTDLAIQIAKRRGTVVRYPDQSPLDEYPLVPFVVEDGRRVYYDSSCVGLWLDDTRGPSASPLLPEEPSARWVARLIDEAFDEFGLYMLHHNRWVVSARDNDAGPRLAAEFARVLPPGVRGIFAAGFSRRQVRRLPYLLSVAPEGFSMPGVSRVRTPPSRVGFPPTHAMLEEAWYAHLDATEAILATRPFLLGERFTIADASAFGQLGGSFIDPSAHDRLREHAPRTHAWLDGIWRGAHVGSTGSVALDGAVSPLLRIIGRTFVPLMQQNARAHLAASRAGETVFNEAAFDRSRALYDGELMGRPFRSVVKTFQVRTWRDLVAGFRGLTAAQRARIEAMLGQGVIDDA